MCACVCACLCVCACICLIDYFSVELLALNFANLGNSSHTAVSAFYLQGIRKKKKTQNFVLNLNGRGTITEVSFFLVNKKLSMLILPKDKQF